MTNVIFILSFIIAVLGTSFLFYYLHTRKVMRAMKKILTGTTIFLGALVEDLEELKKCEEPKECAEKKVKKGKKEKGKKEKDETCDKAE